MLDIFFSPLQSLDPLALSRRFRGIYALMSLMRNENYYSRNNHSTDGLQYVNEIRVSSHLAPRTLAVVIELVYGFQGISGDGVGRWSGRDRSA